MLCMSVLTCMELLLLLLLLASLLASGHGRYVCMHIHMSVHYMKAAPDHTYPYLPNTHRTSALEPLVPDSSFYTYICWRVGKRTYAM